MSFLLSLLLLNAQAADISKYRLETAFIYQFTNFIEWPDAADGAGKDFVISILGESPLQPELADLAANRTVHGRRVVLEVARSLDALKTSHILVVGPDQESQLAAVLKKFKGSATLVVTDADGLGEKGAMINFFVQGDKLRFEINRKAVQHQKFKVGSQLLNLARLIE